MSVIRPRWPARAPAAGTAAVLMAALSACTGSLFKSREPAQAVYMLTIERPPAGARTEVPADLTLLRPRVRPGLDTSLIAALYPDRRLDHFAAARWSAPLQEVVQDLALQAFRGDAHVQNVHTDISSFGSGYWLEIDVADFQAEYGASGSAAGSAPPTIHVRLAARLGASRDRHVLGQFEADVHESATENRLTAIVDAYDRAASAALAKIVADTGEAIAAERSGGS